MNERCRAGTEKKDPPDSSWAVIVPVQESRDWLHVVEVASLLLAALAWACVAGVALALLVRSFQ